MWQCVPSHQQMLPRKIPCSRHMIYSDSVAATDPFVASLISKLGSAVDMTPESQAPVQPLSPSQEEALRRHARLLGPGSGKMDLDVKMWSLPFETLELQRQIGRGSFGRCETIFAAPRSLCTCEKLCCWWAMPCLTCFTWQAPVLLLCHSVYLALWNETPVAVKVLMRSMSPVKSLLEEEDADAAANAAMSLSAPILASLQKVGSSCC